MTDYTDLKARLRAVFDLERTSSEVDHVLIDALTYIEELEQRIQSMGGSSDAGSAAPAPEPDKSIGILPCPCCGYRAELEQVPHAPEEPNAGGYYIECKRAGCGLTTRLAFSCKADAVPGLVKSWNRRPLYAAPQPAQADEARRLLRDAESKLHPHSVTAERIRAYLARTGGKEEG